MDHRNNPANILGIASSSPPNKDSKGKRKYRKKVKDTPDTVPLPSDSAEPGTLLCGSGSDGLAANLAKERVSVVLDGDTSSSSRPKKKKSRKTEGGSVVDPATAEAAAVKTKRKAKSSGGDCTTAVDESGGTGSRKSRGVGGSSAAVTNEESLAAKIEQKLPILVAYFDVFVTSGRVEEAYEDFKHLR